MLRSTLSFGMFAARAFRRARRRRGLFLGSGPPNFTALMISFVTREKTLPLMASAFPFLCLMFAHLLCPAIIMILRNINLKQRKGLNDFLQSSVVPRQNV